MAQLSDDCFAFGGPMLSLGEALDLIKQRVDCIQEIETIPVRQGLARILAEEVAAPVATPAFDNSAVDGYAVRHADLNPMGETVLPVVARLPAGAAAVAPIGAGTAVRIFTGAPMPEGADTVFMQEDVRLDGDRVILPKGLKSGANRRFSGEDFQKGARLLAQGTRLDPRHLAALSAVGLAEVRVRRQLKVALFSTGDELTEPGSPLGPGAQYDSNRTLLATLLERRGVVVDDLGVLRDRREGITAALEAAAARHDLILTSGGVSTGEEDHVKQAVETLGKINFWRLKIKPGRPVALGSIGRCLFVGLPGNPVASFVTFTRLAGPLIDHLAGSSEQPAVAIPAVSDFSYRKKPGRTEYIRAAITDSSNGVLTVRNYANEGAALISSLIGTDGLVELHETTTEVKPGMPVHFLPYRLLY